MQLIGKTAPYLHALSNCCCVCVCSGGAAISRPQGGPPKKVSHFRKVSTNRIKTLPTRFSGGFRAGGGAVGRPPPYSLRIFCSKPSFPYKRHIVHCVHLLRMTTRLIRCLPPPLFAISGSVTDKIGYLVNMKCQTSSIMFSLGFKYFMRDLICDCDLICASRLAATYILYSK